MTISNSGLRKAAKLVSSKAAGTYGTVKKSAKNTAAHGRRAFLKRDAAAEVREETVTLNMFGEPGTGTWSVGPLPHTADSIVIDPTKIIS